MGLHKISTSNGETRWLNLSRITRASLSTEASSGERLLTVCFVNDKLTLRGSSPEDARAIDALLGALDAMSKGSVSAAA